MKKILILLCFSVKAFSQSYYSEKDMICFNEDKVTGFTISTYVESINNELVGELNVDVYNIGDCVEGNKMTITFEDESKINLTSINQFNCDGESVFKIFKNDIKKLSKLKINKIEIINVKSNEKYSKIIEDKKYFINLFYDISLCYGFCKI